MNKAQNKMMTKKKAKKDRQVKMQVNLNQFLTMKKKMISISISIV